MTYSVTMTKQMSLTAEPTVQPAPVRVVLVITGIVGFLDKGIFVDIRDTASLVYRYDHVANPQDLQLYNYNNFTADWARVSTVDRTFLRADLAESFIVSVELAIQALCIDMQLLQDLAAPVTVTISS